MDIHNFIAQIDGFSDFNISSTIKHFCWYISTHKGQSEFKASDITQCYSDAHLPNPTSLSPFLKSLCKKNKPFLIRHKDHYKLTRYARDEYDPKYGSRESTIAVSSLLADLPNKITMTNEKVYLEEAIICFRHGAFRAAIIMVWNLAYDYFCYTIINDPSKLIAFNTQLVKSFPKSMVSSISTRDDFEILKESQVLQVAKSANIISGSTNKIMKEKLDRRNLAAHPSSTTMSNVTAEDCITDLITNVVLKL